ncbi:unnamed protein product [Rotaria sordida]|uniref:Calcineurin-like phosphoesterase domain-containing protein n=1 Tax=Rotaria sordida TaxID=392033 RepID=A0A818YZT7_9BILA|nr:unnamed protein product [Rotaria sordida]CAF3762700.1 unnamed protein product [Rotaria sordida]
MSRLNTSLKYRFNCFYIRSRFYSKLKQCNSTHCQILIITGLLVVFINEVLLYQWARLNWPNIEEIAKKSSVEKLLLVADPQLIGEKDEGILGFITRREADRYLAKTFAQANAYVKPDWIVFLGDIFDEGLSASDDEFKRYFERFNLIFDYKNHEQRYIIIPGDNDVGGEYYGDRQPILRERFRNYFGRIIALYHQNDIEFLKLDMDMFDSFTEGKHNTIMEQIQNRPMTANFRIILNHWPILTRTARFIKPFINELEPNIILKGDSHHFSIISYDRINMINKYLAKESLSQSIFSLDLNQKNFVYEISVPTCSYRMGVQRIGYVVLLLDSESKTAHLTILSTPKRYIALYVYLIYGILGIIFIILTSLFSRRNLIRLVMFSRLI